MNRLKAYIGRSSSGQDWETDTDSVTYKCVHLESSQIAIMLVCGAELRQGPLVTAHSCIKLSVPNLWSSQTSGQFVLARP